VSAPEVTWCGLAYTEWMKLWDEARWRESITSTLVEVARCRGARTKDRLKAAGTLAAAMAHNDLPRDPAIGAFMRDVMHEIHTGESKPGSKKLRKKMSRRLTAACAMLNVGSQISERMAATTAPADPPTNNPN
jgi:hypothetical protein